METLGLGLILSFQDHASHHIHGVIGLLQQLRHSINSIGSISNIATAGLDRIARTAGILGSALTILGGIATGVFSGMVSEITRVGMEMEGMLTALDQMMGSKPKAMSRLLDFEQVAARTPLTFKDVANMGTQLTVVGLDPMKKYEGTWKAHRKRADGKTEGTYSRTLLEALGDLVAMRPDKGVSTAIREGKEFVEGQSRPLKMSYGLSTKEILGEKMAGTVEERADQLVRMLAAANIIGGMEKAGENLHTIFQNLKSDVELFLSYMTLPEEAGAGGFIDYIKKPFKDLFEYMKNFTKQRDIMSTVGKSWAEGFKIVVAPARELIRLFSELIKLALEFSLHHPKIVTFGIAFTGLASQIVLFGGALLVASALFNLFRARVLGGIAFSQFLRNSLIAARISMLAFARSVLPAVASLGLLYYAFRTNLFGIRSLVDSTFNYVSNFLNILFDAMTHYDLSTGLFSLSREHYDLAQEMGILDFITSIVTAEGYVLRFWEGFKKGVSEAQAKLDAMTQKVIEFMYQIGILKKQDTSEASMGELQMTNEKRKPSKSYQQGVGTYDNPIKNNVLYNMVVDKNFEEIGSKIGNVLLPLTLFLTGVRAVTFAAGVLSPVIRTLGTVFGFLGRNLLGIIPLFTRLGSLFSIAISPIRGVLTRLGTFIFTALTRPLTAVMGFIRGFAGMYGALFSMLGRAIMFVATPLRVLWTAFSAGFNTGGIVEGFRNVARFIGNIMRYLLTSIPVVGRYIGALMDIRRVFGVMRMLRGLFLALRLAMATNPIGLALLAIGLAIEFVIAHWEQFEAAALSVWEHVTTTVSEAWERIKTAFEPALEAMSSAWDTFAEAFPGAAEAIASVFGGLIDIFSADADTASAIFNALGTAIKIAFDVAIFAIEAASSVISGIIQIIVGTFEGLIKFIKAVFTGDLSGALDAITGIVSSWGSGISTIVGGIASAFEGLIGRIKAAIDEARGLTTVSGMTARGLNAIESSRNLKGYAEGGIITNPEVAIIGEAGQEVIVPVTRNDSRSKWLARYAAEKTGIISDIVANAQTKNNPVTFEVRGIKPVQETAVLGATSNVVNVPSELPSKEDLNAKNTKLFGGNIVVQGNNPMPYPEPYLPVTANVPIQRIPDSSIIREFMQLYSRHNTPQAGFPIVPAGGNVQAREQRDDPLSYIARENVPKQEVNAGNLITSVTPVEQGNIDLNRNTALRNEDGKGYSIFRPEHFYSESEGLEVLIPTVVEIAKGIWKVVDKNEAIRHYMETGEHLGKFKTSSDAEAFAKAIFTQKEAMAYLRPDLSIVGTAPPRFPNAETGSSPKPVPPLGSVPTPVIPSRENGSAGNNGASAPVAMTELSGVPALDNKYLEQMTKTPVRGNNVQVFTMQPPPKDNSNPPIFGNIFKGLGFFGGNIANLLEVLGVKKKEKEKPPETAVLSTVDRSKLPELEKTSNSVTRQITPATYEEVQRLINPPPKEPKLTFIDKAAIGVGNFIKRIFGAEPKQQTSNPVIQNVEQDNNVSMENPVISQKPEKKKASLWDKFVGGWKSVQKGVGNFLGINREEKTSNTVKVEPVPQKNEEQNPPTIIEQQVTGAVPSVEQTFNNVTTATEKVEGVAPKEEKKKPNLLDRINSGWVQARDSFLGIFGHKKEEDDETGSFTTPSTAGVTSSSGNTSNSVIPLQQNSTAMARSMPVQQSFSASVQLPQQSQASPVGGRGAQNSGDTFVFNEGAIKIEIKDAVEAKKIVPFIRREIDRLKTTRQWK